MAKTKKKLNGTDGLGPHELKKIRDAVRQVWQRCHARNLTKKRCSLPGDYFKCEQCGTTVPAIQIDHLEDAGSILDPGFLLRLFCPSSGLQGLCKACHKPKTAAARKAKKQLTA